jgi:inosine-uridine nucleoside N-ribohydrolase
MNYGKVLRSTGDLRKARDVFERAITIHQINFKEGQRAAELEKCIQEVSEINIQIAAEADMQTEQTESSAELALARSSPSLDVYTSGSPVIVVTDVGRDVDDEYCLVLLSALKRMHLLNPIAVITTLSPQGKRACLARGILDSLALPGVPVGIGSAGGVVDGVELEVYAADYARPCSCVVQDGGELMVEALRSSPDRSVQVLIIAALTDVAALMKEHEELFIQKVKEVIVMGGIKPLDETSAYVEPDSAYNNNCDMDAAEYVYRRCQEVGVPTLTISRYAAYGCPVAVSVLEDLCKTEHMVAHNIKSVSVDSINCLWKKVNYAGADARREKLPPRCDRTWFCRTFFGSDDVDKQPDESIWPLLGNLNMYDPLALMACVSAYRETNFVWDTIYVNGTPHRIAGVSENQNGIVDARGMSDEMASLFGLAFRNALQNIC